MNRDRGSRPLLALGALLALGLPVLAACSPEDPSARFSPSAQTLLGSATGERTLWPEDQPPPDSAPEPSWSLRVTSARFGELENDLPAIEVILIVESRPGAMLEMWLDTPGGARALWRGGPTRSYGGAACWQLPLQDFQDESVVLALDPNAAYTLVAAFRDDSGDVLAVHRRAITHFVPRLEGEEPGPDSAVFRDLVGCRRVGQ